jgi:hypothetical protein
MSSGKNKVALIQSYCNTPEKVEALVTTIKKLREIDVYTCVFSSVLLPREVTDLSTFYIFSGENPVLHYPEKAFNFWLWHFYKSNPDRKFYMNKMFSDYGWTVLNQVQIMSSFVKDLDYEWIYLVNYDLDFDDTVIDNLKNPTSVKIFQHKKHTTLFNGTLIFTVLQKSQLEIICNTFNKQDFINTNKIPEDYFLSKIGDECLINQEVYDTITVEGQQKEQQFNEMPNNDLFKLFIQNRKRLLIYIFDPTKDMGINIHINGDAKIVDLKQGQHQFIHFNIKPEDVKSLTIEIFGQPSFNFSYLFTETAPICWFNDADEQFSGLPPHELIDNDKFLQRLVQYN